MNLLEELRALVHGLASPRALYATFMGLALLAAATGRRLDPGPRRVAILDAAARWTIGLAAFVGGALGAKVPFALASGHPFLSAAAWLDDGKTILAGMAGGYLAVELAKIGLGVRIKTGDSFAFGIALGMTMGRWGCFFNGCCFGVESGFAWAVDFGDGAHRHPAQLYEVAFHAAMAAVLWFLARRDALATHRLQLYLIAYAAYRFVSEFWRPEPEWWFGLSVYQWGIVPMIGALVAQWAWERRGAASTPSPKGE